MSYSFFRLAACLTGKVQSALFGMVLSGMAIAVFGTIFSPAVTITSGLLPLLVVGAVIGGIVAVRIEMTGMPQLVAALHSFIGSGSHVRRDQFRYAASRRSGECRKNHP